MKSSGTGPSGSGSDAADPPKPTFTLFALAEVRGQIGPCGCTSDPLGDIARTARLVVDARTAGPTLFVDAGSLLYSKVPTPPQLAVQENLKADLLADIYKSDLKANVVGLGPADLANGLSGDLKLPRQASNLEADKAKLAAPLRPPEVLDVGGAKVGVFTVIAEGAIEAKLADPVATGKAAVADLRKRGARVVIGMVQAESKKDAARVVRDIGGIDFAIAGLGAAAPEPDRVEIEPQKVGDGWLIVPVNRGQVVPRIAVTLRNEGPLADAVGPGAAAAKIASLDKQLAVLDADLAKFNNDTSADAAFVAQKKQERTQLAEQRDRLARQPLLVPASGGSYFTLEQIRVGKTLACDVGVQTKVSEFYKKAGEANVAAAQSREVPAPAAGEASYVGSAKCVDCHDDEVKFWEKTVHHDAWKTLVDRGQQFDLDCIGCHVTGYDKPGGSNLAHNENLRDVQCETCHGPGSIHVKKGGTEKPAAVRLDPPKDLCASQCHTKEHSDTFQYEAYLRDIVGKGHGEERRKKLGDGPTGAQLRKAALDKAGRTLGAGCIR